MSKRIQKPTETLPKMTKNSVKTMHMAIGVDFIGSKTSLKTDRNTTLEATSIGIKATSKTTKRVVVIPYSNVKGFELFPDAQTEPDKTEVVPTNDAA